MNQDSSKPIKIDPDQLSPESFQGVIENFIQREGTDYGSTEVTPERKFEILKKQIKSGDVYIVFDPESDSVTLINKADYIRLINS